MPHYRPISIKSYTCRSIVQMNMSKKTLALSEHVSPESNSDNPMIYYIMLCVDPIHLYHS